MSFAALTINAPVTAGVETDINDESTEELEKEAELLADQFDGKTDNR